MTTCTLAQTDDFVETLTIRPVAALPGSFEFLIQSQRTGVKDPSALRVLHRVMVSESALNELRKALDQCFPAGPR
jgi:hypothetical protein